MALDVDLLAIGKSRLELLGQDSSGSKPANQLQPGLAQLVESALIESDLRGDVPKPAIDDRAAIDTRQQRAPPMARSPSDAEARGPYPSR